MVHGNVEPADASAPAFKSPYFGEVELSPEQLEIVQSTAPVVIERAEDITRHFYPLMFSEHPEVKSYFNQAHQKSGAQPRALANAIGAYVKNFDKLENLGSAVSLIVHKHCSLNIKPDQYMIVGTCLLKAIKAVLGVDDTVLDAWKAAYFRLANILIDAEEAEYARKEKLPGGWRGGRKFKVVRKDLESDIIQSLYLKPVDGEAIMSYKPGQYIGIRVSVDGEETQRNYSLSAPSDINAYRISVKKEPEHNGVSAWLHANADVGTEITVFPPAGDFVLQDGTRPVVFCTGGIGQTPALAMLEHLVNHAPERKVVWLHGARSPAVHAFRDRIEQIAFENPQVDYAFAYSQEGGDMKNSYHGKLDEEHIAKYLPDSHDVDAYVLGPKPFMQSVIKSLKHLKVPKDQIHWEFFGPLDDVE